MDPAGLYQLADAASGVESAGGLPLIVALTGYVDAGAAVRLGREQLRATGAPEVIATFDVDQLLDYRARRPQMLFVQDHWQSYDEPRLVVELLHDNAGAPYLLLGGPEPDVQWQRFTTAVRDLVARLGVRLTIGLNAIPMAVPHTRPPGVTAHATRQELIAGYEPWLQEVTVPGGAAHLLEFALGQAGRDAMGFAVHVPHYLAQSEYPQAAEVLLNSVSRASGLLLGLDRLRETGTMIRDEIDRRVAESAEVAEVVSALEQQYDSYVRGRESSLLRSETGPLPSAEELGAELERFLAEQSRPDDRDGREGREGR